MKYASNFTRFTILQRDSPLMKYSPLSLLLIFITATSCIKAQQSAEIINSKTTLANNIPLKRFLGINAFEWDFSKHTGELDSNRIDIFKSFGTFRHYMDWEKLESEEGKYSFDPTRSGGWGYDHIYQKCKDNGIEVLSCLKGCPAWLLNTYPEDQRDGENVPAPYGLNRYHPASYIKQAKVAFQFAARYGRNKSVPASLLSVNSTPRWHDDPENQVRIGLDYVKYIECDNERDKTWKGAKAHQNPEEYAANMSAFYDGDMGKLGKNVGVKTADPSMLVVMGGLADPDINYVIKMIAWCKKNRGYKADGSVNLCFDVINYHLYNNDGRKHKERTIGKAPELSSAAEIADEFVSMAKKYAKGMDVWITESGYDLNPGSPQRASAIGQKSAKITQADWMLRSSFLYVRHGLKRSHYYMLDDLDPKSSGPYASSGFADGYKRRPVADYFFQTKNLMGDFQFKKNISADPIVDVYAFGKRQIYVLYIPDEVGRTKIMNLKLGNAVSAKVYSLQPGENEMITKLIPTRDGKLKLTITETPIFVEKMTKD